MGYGAGIISELEYLNVWGTLTVSAGFWRGCCWFQQVGVTEETAAEMLSVKVVVSLEERCQVEEEKELNGLLQRTVDLTGRKQTMERSLSVCLPSFWNLQDAS